MFQMFYQVFILYNKLYLKQFVDLLWLFSTTNKNLFLFIQINIIKEIRENFLFCFLVHLRLFKFSLK